MTSSGYAIPVDPEALLACRNDPDVGISIFGQSLAVRGCGFIQAVVTVDFNHVTHLNGTLATTGAITSITCTCLPVGTAEPLLC